MTRQRTTHDPAGERGASPASVIILITVVLLIAELVVLGGRVAAAHATVSNAAREAARRGSLVQSESAVWGVVSDVATTNLEREDLDCGSVFVHTHGTEFVAGGHVRVRVICFLDLGDLSSFGIPLPSVSVSSAHSEIIETYRAIGELDQ